MNTAQALAVADDPIIAPRAVLALALLALAQKVRAHEALLAECARTGSMPRAAVQWETAAGGAS